MDWQIFHCILQCAAPHYSTKIKEIQKSQQRPIKEKNETIPRERESESERRGSAYNYDSLSRGEISVSLFLCIIKIEMQ
ncbi:MAG: hypothetical protein ACI90V_009361 [Bacillariaceae sp.]